VGLTVRVDAGERGRFDEPRQALRVGAKPRAWLPLRGEVR